MDHAFQECRVTLFWLAGDTQKYVWSLLHRSLHCYIYSVTSMSVAFWTFMLYFGLKCLLDYWLCSFGSPSVQSCALVCSFEHFWHSKMPQAYAVFLRLPPLQSAFLQGKLELLSLSWTIVEQTEMWILASFLWMGNCYFSWYIKEGSTYTLMSA